MSVPVSVSNDLLLLVKGHYGRFADDNMIHRIGRMLQKHYLIRRAFAETVPYQVRMILATLLSVAPSYFETRQHELEQLIIMTAERPEEGLRYLVGILAMLPVNGQSPGIPVITLPEANPAIQLWLDSTEQVLL